MNQKVKSAVLLIVSNDPEARESLCLCFRGAGFSTLQASGVADATALLADQAVDLVLTNVQMEEGSGLDLLRHIRRHGSATPPVLLMSDRFILPEDELIGLGADAIFYQPISPDAMLKAVQSALREQKMAARRKHPRLNTCFTVQFQLAGDTLDHKGRTLNIAREGAFFSTKEVTPELGTEVQFRIEVPFHGTIQGTGAVRWLSPGKFPASPGFGIQFSQLEASGIAVLEKLFRTVGKDSASQSDERVYWHLRKIALT